MARDLGLDGAVDHFTLIGDELDQLCNKSGATRLGFAVLLKFLLWRGRFPQGRHELPDDAVAHLARQVRMPAEDLGSFDFASRTAKRHRTEIRAYTGFRECSVADAEALAGWLAEHVASSERRPERVRGELILRCGAELIGAKVITDGWKSYPPATRDLYVHEPLEGASGADASKLLPGVHTVASLAKRWLLGTHQGRLDDAHLASYLNEFVVRFNRRRSRSRGLVFYRVLELAAAHEPIRYRDLILNPGRRTARPPLPPTSRGKPASLDRPPGQPAVAGGHTALLRLD